MKRFFILIKCLLLSFCLTLPAAANFTETKQKINDYFITSIIKGKITKNKNLNPLNISVTTDNGIVHLTGRVNDKQSFVDTLRIATSTKGVKGIDASDLEIKQVNSAFTDAYITTKIEAAILEAKVVTDDTIPLVGINASTDNGVVTISGTVQSSKSIVTILNRIKNIKGVKKVISNLEIKKQEVEI